MKRLRRLVFLLVVAAICAVVSFAYIGDLSPVQVDVKQPVELDID